MAMETFFWGLPSLTIQWLRLCFHSREHGFNIPGQGTKVAKIFFRNQTFFGIKEEISSDEFRRSWRAILLPRGVALGQLFPGLC